MLRWKAVCAVAINGPQQLHAHAIAQVPLMPVRQTKYSHKLCVCRATYKYAGWSVLDQDVFVRDQAVPYAAAAVVTSAVLMTVSTRL